MRAQLKRQCDLVLECVAWTVTAMGGLRWVWVGTFREDLSLSLIQWNASSLLTSGQPGLIPTHANGIRAGIGGDGCLQMDLWGITLLRLHPHWTSHRGLASNDVMQPGRDSCKSVYRPGLRSCPRSGPFSGSVAQTQSHVPALWGVFRHVESSNVSPL